jgi:AcrR family transcriptional regulator
MAEIAPAPSAQIGSLYRFFPNKEVLADALIQRYGELIDEAFGNETAGWKHLTSLFLLTVVPGHRGRGNHGPLVAHR